MSAPGLFSDTALSTPRLRTEVPGPRSRALHERRQRVVPRGVGSVLPVYIEHADGPWVTDVDGNRFLDLGSGIGVTTIGHTNLAAVTAAAEQLDRVAHTLFTVTPYEGYVRLAELLAEKVPGTHDTRTAFANSGAEAVENAVKIARRHTGRRAVAALDHAFHGRTNLALAMNHKAVPYGSGFGPFAPDVHRVPNSYPYRDGLDGEEAAVRTIAHLEQRIGVRDLAAVIAEPVQGEGGFVIPAEGYLPALQEWCTRNGVVFIADEIQTGLGRTGTWFASTHFDLVPDLVLTAKGIAGGLPLAGVTGTCGGNPVSIAAALAVFDELEHGTFFADARRIGAHLSARLEGLRTRHAVVGDVRGIGAMQAFELSTPGTTRPLAGAASMIAEFAAQRGILLLTAGSDGNVIRFLPTLTTTDEQPADAVDVIDDAPSALR